MDIIALGKNGIKLYKTVMLLAAGYKIDVDFRIDN